VTEAPWHLDALGLPAHADDVAVRRAYAGRLRRLDPAADPAAFQRLRAAYDAARAWCDERPVIDEPGLPRSELAPATPPAPEASVASEAPTAPAHDDAAANAMRRLVDGAARMDPVGLPRLLDDVLASLRLGYIDAPGQFEELFIDALRHASLPQRAVLFDAATTAFNWHEVGHLRAHDARAEWVTRVLSQRETWLSLDADWRGTWLGLLARARNGVDDELVHRWPDMERLRDTLPDWLGLHLTPNELDAWKAAFDRLPDATRTRFQQRSAPASALVPRSARRTRKRISSKAWAVIWFVLMLCYLISNALFTAEKDGNGEPLPHFREAPLSPAECATLYLRFDRPDPFADMPVGEVVQAKRRAQRCALDGHWRPPEAGLR